MKISSSLRAACNIIATDWHFTLKGTFPGWYTLSHYRGRIQSRRGRAGSVSKVRLRVHGKPVEVFVTPQHFGAMQGIFLDDEYDLSQELPYLNPKVIFDLGANVGMAASYLNSIYPGAHFVCVEPDPRNLPLLQKSVESNRINAQIVPSAISSTAGVLNLRIGNDPTCSALETSPMHDLKSSIEVNVTNMPVLLSDLKIERIDLLKIDIEGTEHELLSQNNGFGFVVIQQNGGSVASIVGFTALFYPRTIFL